MMKIKITNSVKAVKLFWELNNNIDIRVLGFFGKEFQVDEVVTRKGQQGIVTFYRVGSNNYFPESICKLTK